jgi:hypothetical protein
LHLTRIKSPFKFNLKYERRHPKWPPFPASEQNRAKKKRVEPSRTFHRACFIFRFAQNQPFARNQPQPANQPVAARNDAAARLRKPNRAGTA